MAGLLAVSGPALASPDAALKSEVIRQPFWSGHRVVLVVLFAALVLPLALFYASGFRWFVVATPSMGETAPVGTLVVTAPVTVDQLRVGSIITFRPPTQPGETYTHRIVEIDAQGIHTQGDINGAVDPWRVHQADLVGQEIAIVPGLGWVVRAAPLLALGAVALWFLTVRLQPTIRAAVRISGLSLVASAVAFVLRPFVGISILSTFVDQGIAKATIVSTGLLPIRALIPDGSYTDLTPGMVGTVSAPPTAALGHFQISTALQLQPAQWIVLIGLCAVPLLWCVIVGLPSESVDDDGQIT